MSQSVRNSAGSPVDGTPALRRRASRGIRPLAIAGLALATIGLVGCHSGPCGGGPCGGAGRGLASGFTNGVRSVGDTVRKTTGKIFHHKKSAPAGDCCGGSAVEGGVVSEGYPAEGAVGSGTYLPGPVPSPPAGAGAGESQPTILDPAPPLGSSLKNKSSSVGPSSLKDLGNKQSAIVRKRSIQSDSPGRGQNLARAALAPSTDRSADGEKGVSTRSTLLDNVPPVDLDEEITRRGNASAVPLEAELINSPVAEVPAISTSSKETEFPSIRAGLQTPLAPGLKHFASVKPNINGGSLPTTDGLDFLKEHGTKTLIDLRDANDVDRSFMEQAKTRGLHHISLPVDVNGLDAATVTRFGEEVNRSEGQPVYFFDRDGTRAGMIWYVHRLTVDKVDAQLASHEAEELGLTDKTAWIAAAKYLDSIKPEAKRVSPRPSTMKPTLPSSKPEPHSSAQIPTPWRSSATVILTGLSAPLVEWSRTAVTRWQPTSANPPALAL